MKSILYIHQYFKTPEEGGALRSYFIARGLIDQGYKVQMITSHNKAQYLQKEIQGIEVHYLPVKYSNDMTFIRRYLSFLKFVYATIRLIPKIQHVDLVYATSTPLTVGLIAIWVKWKEKIPYIFEVRDLWPEAPVQLKVLRSKAAIKMAYFIEKKIYHHAKAIIALSPGIAKDILLSCPKASVTMTPNMADTKFFSKDGLVGNTFTIGYFGALGYANNFEFIVQIAHVCQKHNLKIKFLVAGNGAKKKSLYKSIAVLNLKNIQLLPPKNRYEIRELMRGVDACLTTFLNIPVLETNSPNKFFDGLAAGKLCIVNTKGWLKNLVEKYNCGVYLEADKPEQFPDLIKPFLENKALLSKYQLNARKLAEKEFSKEKLVLKICREVELLLS